MFIYIYVYHCVFKICVRVKVRKSLSAVWDGIAQGKILYGRVFLWSQPEKCDADRAEFDFYDQEVRMQ